MTAKNCILFDNNPSEVEYFVNELRRQTGMEWDSIFKKNNGIRDSLLKKIRYYRTYFTFPLYFFLFKRKAYQNGIILAWQQFYGITLAVLARFFNVNMKIAINILIYKPRMGGGGSMLGRIYFNVFKYALYAPQIVLVHFTGREHLNFCAKMFPKASGKFIVIRYGLNDWAKACGIKSAKNATEQNNFILSIGRSNRDFPFLINAINQSDYLLTIISDSLKIQSKYENINILNSVSGPASHPYFRDCKCVIIPIDNPAIDGGESVLITAFAFSKPVICTDGVIAGEYLENGKNGIAISKNPAELLNAVERIYSDKDFYDNLCRNARAAYENHFSMSAYGKNWGKSIMALLTGNKEFEEIKE